MHDKDENLNQYGTTNAESIRTLLEIWPDFEKEFYEALTILWTSQNSVDIQ